MDKPVVLAPLLAVVWHEPTAQYYEAQLVRPLPTRDLGGYHFPEIKVESFEGPEVWKPIPGFSTFEASSAGQIRSLKSGKILSQHYFHGRYPKVSLWVNPKNRYKFVHRLVCEAFHGPANGRTVNHINGVHGDSRAANLEWATLSENVKHSRSALGHTCRPVALTNSKTGVRTEYPSVAAASKATGASKAMIAKAATNPRARTSGYYVTYLRCPSCGSNPRPTTADAALDEALKDAGRMDFLEDKDRCYWVDVQSQPDGMMMYAGQGPGLREAIDAAIAQRGGNDA